MRIIYLFIQTSDIILFNVTHLVFFNFVLLFYIFYTSVYKPSFAVFIFRIWKEIFRITNTKNVKSGILSIQLHEGMCPTLRVLRFCDKEDESIFLRTTKTFSLLFGVGFRRFESVFDSNCNLVQYEDKLFHINHDPFSFISRNTAKKRVVMKLDCNIKKQGTIMEIHRSNQEDGIKLDSQGKRTVSRA